MLWWSGARCCTSTKAMPGSASAGRPEKNASNAASPPADAPMPTMGQFKSSRLDGGFTALGSRAPSGSFVLRLIVAMILPLQQVLAEHLPQLLHPDQFAQVAVHARLKAALAVFRRGPGGRRKWNSQERATVSGSANDRGAESLH